MENISLTYLFFPLAAMNLLEVTKVLNLSTLVEYLNSTGFSDTLREDKGPFTLFAPTNKAFQALPEPSRNYVTIPRNLNSCLPITWFPRESGLTNLVRITW